MTTFRRLSLMTRTIVIFFFNDTATTEIYTLSLHDALPISARLLILSTGAAAAYALGVRLADAPSWTMKDVLAFAALTVAIAVAEQFSIPLRHRTETVNFSLTDALWAAALPLAHPSVLTFAVAAGVLVGQLARRWAPLKIAFNVSQFVVGITLAEIAFQALRPGTPLQPWTWAAVAIAMSAYFLVNASLVVLVVSLVERKRFRSTRETTRDHRARWQRHG